MLDHFLGKTVTDVKVIDEDIIVLYFGEERLLFKAIGGKESKLVVRIMTWQNVSE